MQADGLSKAVAEALTEESEKAQKAMNVAAGKSARAGAKKLRAVSPRGTRKLKNRKHYADNWTSTKETRYGAIRATIYNKPPTYRIAHLLEKGTPIASARVHIKPVEEEVIKKVEDVFTKEFEK